MDIQEKPLPIVNPWAKPFWDAVREHRLIIQKCKNCGMHVFYPRIACPHCFSDQLYWIDSSGKGSIYSFTVVESNAPSAFIEDIPYVVAIIKLEEGVQMLSNVVECDPYELRCDMPVEVVFDEVNDQLTLPKFRPVEG